VIAGKAVAAGISHRQIESIVEVGDSLSRARLDPDTLDLAHVEAQSGQPRLHMLGVAQLVLQHVGINTPAHLDFSYVAPDEPPFLLEPPYLIAIRSRRSGLPLYLALAALEYMCRPRVHVERPWAG
jgi:hypothetical protein